MTIEQIDRQNPDFLKHIYKIRKQVFENEFGFPKKDRMTQNEWDALSNHYLLINNGKPVGAVAVVNWTGLCDILKENGIDPKLSVAKITKLAILPEARSLSNLKELIYSTQQEIITSHYDFVTANVARPSNKPKDRRMDHIKQTYQKTFGLQEIQESDGSWTLGKQL